jgi:hypothetical protein
MRQFKKVIPMSPFTYPQVGLYVCRAIRLGSFSTHMAGGVGSGAAARSWFASCASCSMHQTVVQSALKTPTQNKGELTMTISSISVEVMNGKLLLVQHRGILSF